MRNRLLAKRIPVPELARAAHGLASRDYEDAFQAQRPDADAHTSEQWGRAVFELIPSPLAATLLAIWSSVCRLRLGPRGSDEHVLGWEIARRSHDAIVLSADSNDVNVRLVLLVGPSRLVLATFTQYKTRRGRLLFLSVAPAHRKVAPYLLARSVRQFR